MVLLVSSVSSRLCQPLLSKYSSFQSFSFFFFFSLLNLGTGIPLLTNTAFWLNFTALGEEPAAFWPFLASTEGSQLPGMCISSSAPAGSGSRYACWTKVCSQHWRCTVVPSHWLSHSHGSEIVLSVLSSVQFSCSVMSGSLQPHELQHARPPCPSPTPVVHPNSCPLSWWCHPTISSSAVPFSSCPQSFPASGSFQMSQPFASGGQSIGPWASASALVLPKTIQGWVTLG